MMAAEYWASPPDAGIDGFSGAGFPSVISISRRAAVEGIATDGGTRKCYYIIALSGWLGNCGRGRQRLTPLLWKIIMGRPEEGKQRSVFKGAKYKVQSSQTRQWIGKRMKPDFYPTRTHTIRWGKVLVGERAIAMLNLLPILSRSLKRPEPLSSLVVSLAQSLRQGDKGKEDNPVQPPVARRHLRNAILPSLRLQLLSKMERIVQQVREWLVVQLIALDSFGLIRHCS